jgi:hypothetical protein
MKINTKKILVVFGNIQFDNDVATIYRVDNCMMIPESEINIIVDSLVNYYDGYIIPQLYSGQIIWKMNKKTKDVKLKFLKSYLIKFIGVIILIRFLTFEYNYEFYRFLIYYLGCPVSFLLGFFMVVASTFIICIEFYE